MWLSLIEMLRKKEKLPAVAFIFSRKRIDETSQQLQSVDLLTSSERSEVHVFFQRCISKLKGSDRDLPQVSLKSLSLVCFLTTNLVLLMLHE